MIDLHTHILPGIDDGARTLDESLAIARAALADGIEIVAATPHVREDYPTGAQTMEDLMRATRAALAEAGLSLDVRPGGEIALSQLGALTRDELRRFGLGGSPRHVLLEFPYLGWPLELSARVFDLRTHGITPVLAHPERNGEVQVAPERLRPLVHAGALVQVTAASLDGRLGRRSASAARELLQKGLAHLVASDAHAASVREIGMRAARDAVGDGRLAHWLTYEVPAAIIAGEEAPQRPARPRRRPWKRPLP